jgi:hypothetical protein
VKAIRPAYQIATQEMSRSARLVAASTSDEFRSNAAYTFAALGFKVEDDVPVIDTNIRVPSALRIVRPIYASAPGGHILLVTTLRARQYKHAAVPILGHLAGMGKPVACICAHHLDIEPELDQLAFQTEGLRSVRFLHPSMQADILFCPPRSVEGKALREAGTGWLQAIRDDAVLSPYLALLKTFAQRQIPKTFAHILATGDALWDHVVNAHCVAVAPGRYVAANLAVSLAQASGIPTVEIQSGPISPTKRFIKPAAEHVLCNDAAGYDVYTGYLGCDPESVHTVGSPKLDFELAAARLTTKDAAWSRLGAHFPYSDELVVMASQPIGVDRMTELVGLMLAVAAKRPSAAFLIKQHPSETDSYDRLYADLIVSSGLSNVFVSRDAAIYDALVAADTVMTYYSTCGVEAHALGKRVIVLNPFEGRPPYDIVSFGAAQEARTSSELLDLLAQPFEPMGDLNDGLSAQRCADFIGGQAALYVTLAARPTAPARGQTIQIGRGLIARRRLRTLPAWQKQTILYVADHKVWRLPGFRGLKTVVVNRIVR